MKKTIGFETALKRLEEIVNQMEAGDIDLDKTLADFEEGIKLVRFCSSKLEEAKKKIEVLVKKDGKTLCYLNLRLTTYNLPLDVKEVDFKQNAGDCKRQVYRTLATL